VQLIWVQACSDVRQSNNSKLSYVNYWGMWSLILSCQTVWGIVSKQHSALWAHKASSSFISLSGFLNTSYLGGSLSPRGWWRTGTVCPRRLWMSHPWRHSRPGWMWLWAAWSADWQHVAGGLKLDDHCGPFQPRLLYDSMIYYYFFTALILLPEHLHTLC